MAKNILCLECGNRPPSGGRGLCRTCYNDTSIRLRYPQLSHTVDTSLCCKNFNIGATDLPEPTSAAPGSEEKIHVLQQRIANNQQLHVEGDTVLDTEKPSAEPGHYPVRRYRRPGALNPEFISPRRNLEAMHE